MGFPSSVTATDWYQRFGERIERDLAFALTMYRFPATSLLHLSSHRHLRAAPVVIVFLMYFILFAEPFLAGFPKWYVYLPAKCHFSSHYLPYHISSTSRVIMRARSKQVPPVEPLTPEISVTASDHLRFAPSTLYYMGSNKVSFRGVSSQKDMAHNRCIVVGDDRIVYQNITGACKTLIPYLGIFFLTPTIY